MKALVVDDEALTGDRLRAYLSGRALRYRSRFRWSAQ